MGEPARRLIAVGYFTAPEQRTPAFDPGLDVPCPVCGEPLSNGEPLREISLMPRGHARSYFYRLHKACFRKLSRAGREALDAEVIEQALSRPQ